MLVTEGRVVNRKRTYRLYREEGLQVRRIAAEEAQHPEDPDARAERR